MKLQKQVEKDWKDVQKRANALFEVYASDIMKMIDTASKDIIASLAASLSMYPEITYQNLQQGKSIDRISQVIHHRCDNLALEIEKYWTDHRYDFDLMARLSLNFITLKTSPPWIKKHLDLKSDLSKDGRFDPRMGHLRFYLHKMADGIMNQVTSGALKEETLNQILSRVRAMFNKKKLMGVRESAFDPYGLEHDVNITPDGEYQETLRGSVEIAEGTYTIEDVSRFQDQQRRAMNWEYRQYDPAFSDEIKRNNRYLRDLEQSLMSDAIDLMHSGVMQQMRSYPDEFGIEDMVWAVSRPQNECDECTVRDGLTMKEIKAKIDDEWGDQPAPLHPNCRCQLIPKIKDDWADKTLKDSGMEWDSETGITYRADEQEKKYGIKDMTFDEYLANIPR